MGKNCSTKAEPPREPDYTWSDFKAGVYNQLDRLAKAYDEHPVATFFYAWGGASLMVFGGALAGGVMVGGVTIGGSTAGLFAGNALVGFGLEFGVSGALTNDFGAASRAGATGAVVALATTGVFYGAGRAIGAGSAALRSMETSASKLAPLGASREAASLLGGSRSAMSSVTKADLVAGLRGTTTRAGAVAEAIADGRIGVNILGDQAYARYIASSAKEGAKLIPGTARNQIFLRASDPDILASALHEGSHALDNFAVRGAGGIFTWTSELRAYYFERQYHIYLGQSPRFATLPELGTFVRSNYTNELIWR